MRIGINARFLYSEILEGIGRYTWEITRAMAEAHPEDTFILFVDRNIPSKYRSLPNIEVVRVSPQARHPILFYLWFEIFLPKAVKKNRIDVFYSPDNFTSLSLEIPNVLVIHDIAYKAYPQHFKRSQLWYYKYFTPKFVKKVDHIITVSQYVKEDVVEKFKVEKEKISVAYNACPIREHSNYSKTIEYPYFLYVGSINPRKNIFTALNAFKIFIINNPEYKFVLIGQMYGLDRQTEDLISEMSADGNVVHLTGLLDHELNHYLSNAEALIYISLFEGFGIPILESMAVGTPVITSNISSMPEVGGEAAICVDPLDIDAVIRAMITLTSNQQLRDRMINQGYDRVKQFSWKTSASLTYNIINGLNK